MVLQYLLHNALFSFICCLFLFEDFSSNPFSFSHHFSLSDFYSACFFSCRPLLGSLLLLFYFVLSLPLWPSPSSRLLNQAPFFWVSLLFRDTLFLLLSTFLFDDFSVPQPFPSFMIDVQHFCYESSALAYFILLSSLFFIFSPRVPLLPLFFFLTLLGRPLSFLLWTSFLFFKFSSHLPLHLLTFLAHPRLLMTTIFS